MCKPNSLRELESKTSDNNRAHITETFWAPLGSILALPPSLRSSVAISRDICSDGIGQYRRIWGYIRQLAHLLRAAIEDHCFLAVHAALHVHCYNNYHFQQREVILA